MNEIKQQDAGAGGQRLGIRYGLLLMAAGLILVGINFGMLEMSGYYYPKLLLVGFTGSILSPVFIIFPGNPVAGKPAFRSWGRELFRNAGTAHKVAWIVWGLLSFVLAFLFMQQIDPDFMK